MSIGEKNRQIEIWKPTDAVDGANQPLGWCFFKSKWAKINGEPGMGKIRAASSAGGIVTPSNRYSFRVNYDRCIDTTMQVRTAEGDRMAVLSVLHDLATRNYSDIVCELGGSNG